MSATARGVDLTGQTFGALFVVRRIYRDGGKASYLCRCECGARCDVRADNLRNGNTSSCGCQRAARISAGRVVRPVTDDGRIARPDIAGQTFGRLTAVRPSEVVAGRDRLWECLCTCGKTTHAIARKLREGRIRSCGCSRLDALARGRATQAAERAAEEIQPPPPSAPQLAPRMLPIVPRGDSYANAQARAWGVERRHDCDRYDACLDRVPHAAIDARCPRECPGYEVAESETRTAMMIAAVARTTFDPASQYPSTRGLATRRESRRE